MRNPNSEFLYSYRCVIHHILQYLPCTSHISNCSQFDTTFLLHGIELYPYFHFPLHHVKLQFCSLHFDRRCFKITLPSWLAALVQIDYRFYIQAFDHLVCQFQHMISLYILFSHVGHIMQDKARAHLALRGQPKSLIFIYFIPDPLGPSCVLFVLKCLMPLLLFKCLLCPSPCLPCRVLILVTFLILLS